MSAAVETIGPIQETDLVRVYVWDVVVRVCHWAIALSILVLSVTGTYLGYPWIVVSHDAATQHFVMGTMKIIHFYTAIVFTLAVLSRILWMFVGTRWASFHQFLPLRAQRWREMWETLKFYLLIKRDGPVEVGHNPLAGGAYSIVFGLYLVMILTGLGLYGMSATDTWLTGFKGVLPLFMGAQGARYVHHIVMWLLIGFFVHHFYSALLVSLTERTGTLESIFSGYKWFKRPSK